LGIFILTILGTTHRRSYPAGLESSFGIHVSSYKARSLAALPLSNSINVLLAYGVRNKKEIISLAMQTQPSSPQTLSMGLGARGLRLDCGTDYFLLVSDAKQCVCADLPMPHRCGCGGGGKQQRKYRVTKSKSFHPSQRPLKPPERSSIHIPMLSHSFTAPTPVHFEGLDGTVEAENGSDIDRRKSNLIHTYISPGKTQ
jgi:hypothetical protein